MSTASLLLPYFSSDPKIFDNELLPQRLRERERERKRERETAGKLFYIK